MATRIAYGIVALERMRSNSQKISDPDSSKKVFFQIESSTNFPSSKLAEHTMDVASKWKSSVELLKEG